MTNSERAAKALRAITNLDKLDTASLAAIIRREIPGVDAKPDDWTEDDGYSVACKRAQAITHGTDIKLTVDEFDRLFAQLKRGDDL